MFQVYNSIYYSIFSQRDCKHADIQTIYNYRLLFGYPLLWEEYKDKHIG